MRFFNKIIDMYKILIKKDYSTHSGAIAFFLIINGGSIAFLMLFISQLLNIDLPITNDILKSFFNTIENNIDDSNSFYNIFFISASIFGASSLFYHLLKIGEIIYERKNKKISFLKRITAIIFLTTFIFIIEICVILLVLSRNVFSNFIWLLLKNVIFIVLPFIIALCINFFVIPDEVKLKNILKGSLITTFLWYCLTFVFSIFVSTFQNYKAIYGALTFFIVFMVWVYLIAQGLVIGIIFNEQTKNVKLFMIENDKNIDGTPKKEVYEKV